MSLTSLTLIKSVTGLFTVSKMKVVKFFHSDQYCDRLDKCQACGGHTCLPISFHSSVADYFDCKKWCNCGHMIFNFFVDVGNIAATFKCKDVISLCFLFCLVV